MDATIGLYFGGAVIVFFGFFFDQGFGISLAAATFWPVWLAIIMIRAGVEFLGRAFP